MSLQIQSVTFAEQGMVVTYSDEPADIRVEGKVVLVHQALIDASHPDYREDIELLHAQAVRALKNALEDFHDSEPYAPPEDDVDPDDDRGFGEY